MSNNNGSGSGSGSGKGRAGPPAPTYVKKGDGYYKRIPDDGNTYYLGSDKRYHVLVFLRGATGLLPEGGKELFTQWMQEHNNTFMNDRRQAVELDSAIMLPDGFHQSTALGDPHSPESHYTLTLTNATLTANDRSTHLVHYRPQNMAHTVFYDHAYTATEVTKMQNSRRGRKGKNLAKKDDNKGGPSGSGKK